MRTSQAPSQDPEIQLNIISPGRRRKCESHAKGKGNPFWDLHRFMLEQNAILASQFFWRIRLPQSCSTMYISMLARCKEPGHHALGQDRAHLLCWSRGQIRLASNPNLLALYPRNLSFTTSLGAHGVRTPKLPRPACCVWWSLRSLHHPFRYLKQYQGPLPSCSIVKSFQTP